VATSPEVAGAAQAAKLDMVDAPVSGGVAGAQAAGLTFMVGGPDAAAARARPLLAAMGKTIVHAGGAGNGQAGKICNNLILGISMIGVSEAFVLAEKLGLDHQALFDISSTASGQCWSLTSYCPVAGPVPASPANRDYAPGFTADMMLKDLKLAQAAAQEGGAASPLGAAASAIYALFSAQGQGAQDFSGIINFLRGRG
ncbi:MAG: NAD-binding protein, partial [Hyphomicrobiales bacterium]